jgi:NADH-quinone oxidoreductase subunit E
METDLVGVKQIVTKYREERGALLGALQDIQEHIGWLPEAALRLVSADLGYPLNQVYAVATFYRGLRLEPRGKHVCKVCLGTACHVRGGALVLEELERRLGIEAGDTTPDGRFTLDIVNCVGACAIGPVVEVDEERHGDMSPAKIEDLLNRCREDR